jgi:uncharacterized protein YcfJ
MRKLFLIAGLTVALATPAVATFAPTEAAAQSTRCERNKANNRLAGTVGGGILGALAGSAIDGGRNNTAGLVIGGVGGAVVGNQLTKGRHPCPTGYTQRSYNSSRSTRSSGTRAVASNCSWEDQRYRDSYGNVTHRQVQVCR